MTGEFLKGHIFKYKKGVVDFFKRKFDFESIERVPKFSDVKREYNMDEDLKASGYSKMVEEAIEEELRPIEEESEGSDGERTCRPSTYKLEFQRKVATKTNLMKMMKLKKNQKLRHQLSITQGWVSG